MGDAGWGVGCNQCGNHGGEAWQQVGGRERRGFLLRRLPGRVTPPALQPRLGFELPEDLAGSPPSGGGEVASCSLLSGQAQCVLEDPYVSR